MAKKIKMYKRSHVRDRKRQPSKQDTTQDKQTDGSNTVHIPTLPNAAISKLQRAEATIDSVQ